jgi:hypothetical protein
MEHDRPLTIQGTEVRRATTEGLQYLGIFLNSDLSGRAHQKQLQTKAVKLTAALSSIAGST